jgi:hypothetical protein
MVTLQVDFNEYDEEGLLTALLRHHVGSEHVEVGHRVLLRDGEDNRAWGRVTRLENGVAFVEVDWPTWQASRPRQRQRQGWWIGPVGQMSQSAAQPSPVRVISASEDLRLPGSDENTADDPVPA